MSYATTRAHEGSEHSGIVNKARLEAALAELDRLPRPPEFTPLSLITGRETVHKYASAGDATPPQTIVKGSGFSIRNTSIWLIFWGSEWTNKNPPVDPNGLIAAAQTIAASDYIAYLKEYGVDSAKWGSSYFDSSNPPAIFNDATIQNKVVSLIVNKNVPHPNTGNFDDTFYCVMMPSTSTYGPGGASGAHSAATWKDPNDNHTYRPFVAWIGNGSLNAMTATFSHELAEAVSDPQGTWIQIAPASSSSWNEICDVCASVAFLNGVAVSSYWSNLEQACVIPVNRFSSVFQVPPTGLSLQVLAIQKAYSVELRHEWIYAIRTRDNSTGIEYDLYRGQAAGLIDSRANSFFVVGGDGSTSAVITRSTGDHEYLTTNPDASTADNLLSLPQFA